MIVSDAVKVEGCLEGSNVYDIKLVGEIDKKFIDHLGEMGKLTYKDNYEKPFFRVIVRGKYTLKGVESNSEIRVILPDNGNFNDIRKIMEHIKIF